MLGQLSIVGCIPSRALDTLFSPASAPYALQLPCLTTGTAHPAVWAQKGQEDLEILSQ